MSLAPIPEDMECSVSMPGIANLAIDRASHRSHPKRSRDDDDDEEMSQSIYQSIAAATSQDSSQDEKESAYKALRSDYEKLMNERRGYGPNGWKLAFYMAAKLQLENQHGGKRRLVEPAASAANEQHTITFASSHTGDKVYTINRRITPVVFVGRLDDCELQYDTSDLCTSRCQMIIFCNPGADIMIIDLGSVNGYEVVSTTSNDGLKDNTTPEHRDVVAVFPKDESIVLRWGKMKPRGAAAAWNVLKINPPICVVCLDNARSVRYACNHSTTCIDCHTHQIARAINSHSARQCEVCRANVTGVACHDWDVHTVV